MAIKEKPVELIELFYDLIFVYAISKLTALVSEPIGGIIPPYNFITYIISSFVILQAWLYFTNYVNRYGQWKWYDYLIACINMIAVIYMANTISPQWESMALTFNISMLVMLLTVIVLYSVHANKEKSMLGAAGNSIKILTVVCLIYIIAILSILLNVTQYIIVIDVVAVLTGAFLPFFIKGKFDKSIISFPHLVERFELLTIITFGEAVVGMTHFFDVNNFDLIPILIFFVVLTMFGSYVVQIHELVEHKREERSLRLMFSHYFIVISINLMTVAFELIHSGDVNFLFTCIVMILSLFVFYLSIMTNKQYYKESVSLSKKDISSMVIITAIGFAVMLMAMNNLYLFLIGVLIITFGNFEVLLIKYKRCLCV